MEVKKTPEADLEKEKATFFLLGFTVVFSFFFVLMEWKSSDFESDNLNLLQPVFIEQEYSENISVPEIHEEEKSLPPEEPSPKIVFEDYDVVEKVDETAIQEKIDDEQQQVPTEKEEIVEKEKKKHPDTIHSESDEVYTSTDVMPQFPGGYVALIRYIYEHIKYPSAALKQKIQGRVWCSFIVNKDGSVSNISLEEGVYIFLDEEAIRVLATMPNWSPALVDKKEVRMKIYLPIVFKL
ncbi:protein TonB [Bacteroidia bacterium]|nr:protein TonB [Bacteroidia bacterium]